MKVRSQKFGLDQGQRRTLTSINKKWGTIFITGSCGNGKSTITDFLAEDFRSWTDENIPQYEVNEDSDDLTFSEFSLLKFGEHIARKAPDLIHQLSAQGHKTYVELPGKDGFVEAFTRIADWGFSPVFIATHILALIHRKKIPILCEHCKVLIEDMESLSLPIKEGYETVKELKVDMYQQGDGCRGCDGTGIERDAFLTEVFYPDFEPSDEDIFRRTIAGLSHRLAIEGLVNRNHFSTLEHRILTYVERGLVSPRWLRQF